MHLWGKRQLTAPLFFAAILAGCGEDTTAPQIPAPPPGPSIISGADSTFEIMTWNIEWFPKSDETTVAMVRDIIDTLDVDLIAVQEIADTTAFRTLLQSLEDFGGFYSPDVYDGDSYQKTGIIYREAIVSVGNHYPIFTDPDDGWAFPRPPMRYAITVQGKAEVFDFVLIVIHLKAMGSWEDIARRREAAVRLKDYLDSHIAAGSEKDYVVAGDWNDEIDDLASVNSFTAFLESDAYHFLTFPLAGSGRDASYPYLGSLIDHILVSEDALAEYDGGAAHTQRLDDVYPDYFRRVSDHRPVMATFPVF